MDKKLGIAIQAHVDAMKELDDYMFKLSTLKVSEWKAANFYTKEIVRCAKKGRSTYLKFLLMVEGGNKVKKWIRYTLRS